MRIDEERSTSCQVAVIGAGHAGLCAGIAAVRAGASSVVVIEAAPREFRGGNSALTKSMRFPWPGGSYLRGLLSESTRPDDAKNLSDVPAYTPESFYQDWLRVGGDQADTKLIASIVRRSGAAITRMYDNGHRWVPRPEPLPGDVPVVFEGGGQRLQERNFRVFDQYGGKVFYDSAVTDIEATSDGRYLIHGTGPAFPLSSAAVVLASGGFEGDQLLRERHLGESWRDVKLRGSPFNTGKPLAAALALGADSAGNWSRCHSTPQGTALPASLLPGQMRESHGLTRYAFPWGIVVNRDGYRFFDESAERSSLSYVTLGQRIMAQPGQIAFQIFDGKVVESGVLPAGYREDSAAVSVPTLADGARRLDIEPANLINEVRRFNESSGRDTGAGMSTALRTPPFLFVPVVTGLTFTYGGLAVSTGAEVLGSGKPISGLYAAGVIAGGLYDQGYPAGTGLMAGAVLGHAAGEAAAAHAIRWEGAARVS